VSGLVLDCSIAIAWCFDDEAAPETDSLLERVRDEGAIVPAIWALEIGNVLTQAERRGRITEADSVARLQFLGALSVKADGETSHRAWREVLALARTEALTTYDAAYLELAMRSGLPLATKDRELAAAARRTGVKVLPG
jgi:predicted nucleic acid-binding protein